MILNIVPVNVTSVLPHAAHMGAQLHRPGDGDYHPDRDHAQVPLAPSDRDRQVYGVRDTIQIHFVFYPTLQFPRAGDHKVTTNHHF